MYSIRYRVVAATLTITATLGLGACDWASQIRDESSPFYSIPPGSTLVLNQDIEIAGDQVSVYMQGGKLMPERNIEHFSPYCKFEIRTMAETPRTVKADRFTIESVYDNMEYVSLDGMRVAGLWHAYDGPSVYTYTTYMELVSPRQPDVLRMSCMHWEDILHDNYLSIQQMRRAMGELFSLEIRDASPG